MGKSKTMGAGHVRTIGALVLREMSSRYGRSPGGYVWALLEPLGMIIILSIGFSLLLRTPSLGNSFILFYATGFLPYNLYQKLASTVTTALRYSRSLLTYPAVTWLDAVAGRIILNVLTGILVSYILIAGLLAFTESRAVISYGPILLAFLMASIIGIGIGLMNCVIIGFFPVWKMIWGVLTRPLFIASGVILIYEDLPKTAQDVIWYNPLIHVTGLMRTGFYPTYAPQYISKTYVMAVALILVAFGLMLMRKHNRTILNR